MDKKNEEIDTKQYTFKLYPTVVESIDRFSQQMAQAIKSMQYVQKYLAETAKLISPIVPPALPKYVLQLG